MLPKYFVILKKSGADRYVFALELSKTATNLYNSTDYEYVHWVTDCCGEPPKINVTTPWVDTRTYDIKRRCGYMMEADECYLRYRGQVEDGVVDATAKVVWTDARNAIRTKYPH